MIDLIGDVLVVLGSLWIAGVLVTVIVFAALEYLDPDDEGDPYRDALDASARISALGYEADQLMHEAAAAAKREER